MALVNIVTKIELDVYDFNLTPSLVKTIALDSGIRTIEAVIREKGQLYDIGQDATVVLTVMRPDKTGVQITGETCAFVNRSGDDQGVTVYGTKVDLTQAALAIKGKLPAQFKITSGDRIVRTEVFTIENGQALDADITDWVEYQGHNLDEMAQSIEDLSSDVSEIQEDVSELKSGLTNTNKYFNFESGSFSTTTTGYNKVDNIKCGRTIVPFIAKQGDAIELSDTNYEFFVAYYEVDSFARVSSTGWISNKFNVSRTMACMVAFRHKDQSTNIIIPDTVNSIFTSDSVNVMCRNMMIGKNNQYVSQTRYLSGYSYSNLLANVRFQGSFLAKPSEWNDLPQNTGANLFAIYQYRYDPTWWVQEATTVNSNKQIKRYVRIIGEDSRIYRNWMTFELDSITPDATNYYYNTSGASIVGPLAASSKYVCAKVACFAGERFTISGKGGPAGSAYAFVDANNVILEKSAPSASLLNSVIVAPNNAAYLVLNALSTNGYSWIRGEAKILLNDFVTCAILNANIADVPSAITKPTIEFVKSLKNGNACQAKSAIFRNQNAFCLTYNENLDGTISDFPRTTDSGVLAMKYTALTINNGNAENEQTGVIARKGSSYTAWDGTTKTFEGGCGLTSGNHGYLFFSAAYNGSHRYNGMNNYGMTPCCVPVTVDANSGQPTFGTIHELVLDINGISGAFDVARLSQEYVNYQLYYTTTPPYFDKSTSTWWLFVPVIRGFIICSSADAVNWEYVTTINTAYQSGAEITCAKIDGTRFVYACRSTTMGTIIGVIDSTGWYIQSEYIIPSVNSRAVLAKMGNELVLLFNEITKDACVFVRITENEQRLFFSRWFSMFHECTWYASIEQDSVLSDDFTKIYVIGGNGALEGNRGVSFAILNLPNGYQALNEIGTMIL